MCLFTAALAWFTALAALSPASALCFEVLVVKNADLKPYQDVLQGVKNACGCKVRELQLSDEEGSEKILQRHADAVVVIGTTVFKKAAAIRHLPVIYTMVMPSETAHSLHPNISGVSMDISPSAYVSAIKEVFPKEKRIGLLYDPRQTGGFVQEAATAAKSAGVTLLTWTVSDTRNIPTLLEEMRKAVDVFWMIPDTTVVTAESVPYLFSVSFQHNLPVFSFSKKYVEMGAVAALDIDPYDMGTQAGEILKQLSQGRNEAVRVYARSFHLTVNGKVAAKMGIAIGDQTTRRNP